MEEDEDWCPPLPARTYLVETSREELSSLPPIPDELSYIATLASSPQRDALQPGNSPRLPHLDLMARHLSGSQVSQSNPDLFTNTKARDASEVYHTSQWAENFKADSLGKGQFNLSLMPHIRGRDVSRGNAQPHGVI